MSLYKDPVVGGRRSARLLAAVGVSEVLNAMQTRFKKIYSDTYRGILKGHVSSCSLLNEMQRGLYTLSRG